MVFKVNGFQLRAAAAAMVVAAAALLLLSILLPTVTAVTPSNHARASTTAPATQTATEAISFTDLMDVALQRPLVDARPATNPVAIAGVDAMLGLRLIGTIIEPMHSYAIFTDAAGKTEVKSVGDRTGLAQVLAVNADAVTLFVNGKSIVLHVVKPALISPPGL